MKSKWYYMTAGLMTSILLHIGLIVYLISMSHQTLNKKEYHASLLVPVKIVSETKKPAIAPVKKPEPPKAKAKPKPKPRKKPVKVTPKTKTSPVPVAHRKSSTKPPTHVKDVKPVFGVTAKTPNDRPESGMAVRIGNTLNKEQETEYTPPDKVKEYITVPVFELTTLPVFKDRVKPEYPESLKKEDVQGEVALSALIDEQGNVAQVKVLHADNMLFAQAAMDALKKSRFLPATQNGLPVSTILDDLVYSFVLGN